MFGDHLCLFLSQRRKKEGGREWQRRKKGGREGMAEEEEGRDRGDGRGGRREGGIERMAEEGGRG